MRLRQSLPPAPPSVGQARRLVSEALRTGPCSDRLDEILLLVSEVMTNAVLHAGTPIDLGVSAEAERVRVEVADSSPVPPVQRDYDRDASTGRGLGLVSLLADEHGVEARNNGKAVWFVVEGEATDDAGTEASLEHLGRGGWEVPAAAAADCREVRLLGVPVEVFCAMRQHDDALLREHALMSLAEELYEPPQLPADLAELEAALSRARADGTPTVDVTLPVHPDAAHGARALLDVLATADQGAARGDMLTPAPLPEVRRCRRWHLAEIAGQLAGMPPRRWAPQDVRGALGQTVDRIDRGAVLDALPGAVVVTDAQTRIAYANAAADELLGWDAEELVGKPLAVLIPQRLRDRHVAAVTAYLVTGQSTLGHHPLRAPALRRDGAEVEVDIELSIQCGDDGQPLFVATLRRTIDVTDASIENVDAARG